MRKRYYFLLVLLLTGCTQTENLSTNNEHAKMNTGTDTAFTSMDVASEYSSSFEDAIQMQLFMYEDLSIVKFEGYGNEYASYQVKTNWLSKNLVRQVVDNGGSIMTRYYRIGEHGITLIKEVESENTPLTAEQLKGLPSISTLIGTPLEVGQKFDNWTIEKMNMPYETPYKAFEHVIVTMKKEDNQTTRNFFVAGIGLVATEFEILNEDGTTDIISSKLSAIEFQ
ncbi:hypothetical protein CSE16_09335 [Solibacillus sp. R5-41]|uniref:hypothetical protein n=1 Tax=Solibacillus sp. R5-41 TaxID=2048654 RepID=UPI000C129281|nr:hypothetical protein [Solibacillus sp. R5-41]ATP40228.1 hypothetical protein CSE16_09335 [Solibacillus sp. R5-41]